MSRMMTRKLSLALGLALLVALPLPALAQSTTSTGVAMPPAHVKGTHRAREQHRSTIHRQRARATSEHARRVRQGQ